MAIESQKGIQTQIEGTIAERDDTHAAIGSLSHISPMNDVSPMNDGEEKVQHDLNKMRGDAQAHLTGGVVQYIIRQPQGEDATSFVLSHLCSCLRCRSLLYDTLQMCGVEEAHPAYMLVKAAEGWERWETAGHRATETAHAFLREHGANIISMRDGVIYEELPNGTVQIHINQTEKEAELEKVASAQ